VLLVAGAWLESRLRDPGLRVIDASWYLPAQNRDARAEYAAGHVPGAVFLDLSTDLADSGAALRNTVAPPEALARAFAAAGIGTGHHVVVYDRLGGYSAGRVWWCLRYAGHARVSLLDGGFARWVTEGRPVSAEIPRLPPAEFAARPRPALLRGKADVLRAVRGGGAQIVDARSLARFRGEGEERPHGPPRHHDLRLRRHRGARRVRAGADRTPGRVALRRLVGRVGRRRRRPDRDGRSLSARARQ
jgi:thiosulfate/3-mercaptopyruvate sulfurtransferase